MKVMCDICHICGLFQIEIDDENMTASCANCGADIMRVKRKESLPSGIITPKEAWGKTKSIDYDKY